MPIKISKVATNPGIIALRNDEGKVTKKVDANVNINGNLPLQGTKVLVRIAINLSLLESIIRVPITPVALQPKPIHIVRLCLPWQPHRLK